jgi:hypothetical protein
MSASPSVGTSTAAMHRHEPLERAAPAMPPVTRKMPEGVLTPPRPAMVPTDPRSSTDSRGRDFNHLLIAELDMQDADATEVEINEMIARAVGAMARGLFRVYGSGQKYLPWALWPARTWCSSLHWAT